MLFVTKVGLSSTSTKVPRPVSIALLNPALASTPPNRFADALIDECFSIFLRQAVRPFFKSLLGQHGDIRVWIPKRSMQLQEAPPIKVIANNLHLSI